MNSSVQLAPLSPTMMAITTPLANMASSRTRGSSLGSRVDSGIAMMNAPLTVTVPNAAVDFFNARVVKAVGSHSSRRNQAIQLRRYIAQMPMVVRRYSRESKLLTDPRFADLLLGTEDGAFGKRSTGHSFESACFGVCVRLPASRQ